MPAWFGVPQKSPFVADARSFEELEDAARVFGDIWAEAFKVGDTVRIGGLSRSNVAVVIGYEKEWVAGRGKGWRMTVRFPDGEEMNLAPHAVEKVSLLDALAEAADPT